MSFRARLILIHTLLVIVITLGLGLGFVAYATTQFESNARSIYSQIADRMISQFDNQFQLMDFYELNLISNEQVRSSLDTMANVDPVSESNQFDLGEARATVKSALISYAAIRNFVATIVFNAKGDFFSSDFLGHADVSDARGVIQNLSWIRKTLQNPGHKFLLPPYEDPWNPALHRRVFGLVRAMPGAHEDLGFLEVQGKAEILTRIFEVAENGIRAVAWTADDQLFYCSPRINPAEAEVYHDWAGQEGAFTRISGIGDPQMIFHRVSDESGLRLVLSVDRSVLNEPVSLTFLSALLVGLGVISFSVFYNWRAAIKLTQPIRIIQSRIEQVGLENPETDMKADHFNDELAAINLSFEQMKVRLDKARESEIQLRILGLQTRFDLLQSQIDPHFIYNTLNLIAAKGHELGSRKIPEICASMARMLRYSTDTLDKAATFSTEVHHVQTYLSIMKDRLEDHLDFHIELDPSLASVSIPKVVLQPLVENSFRHGFTDVDRKIVITLRAFFREDRWRVEISDNGQGFGAPELDRQRAILQDMADDLRSGGSARLGWGGLGLKNTFARLWIFCGGDLSWSLEDKPGEGALIVFGGPCVQSTGS